MTYIDYNPALLGACPYLDPVEISFILQYNGFKFCLLEGKKEIAFALFWIEAGRIVCLYSPESEFDLEIFSLRAQMIAGLSQGIIKKELKNLKMMLNGEKTNPIPYGKPIEPLYRALLREEYTIGKLLLNDKMDEFRELEKIGKRLLEFILVNIDKEEDEE